ncbi:MAG: aldo/keto reductase [Bacteroidales bacterium]
MKHFTIKSMILAIICLLTTEAYTQDTIINNIPYIKLNDNNLMPRIGIGTFNVPGDSTATVAIKFALQNGYRHIDTAHAYRVERGVGQGVKESGVPRKEIWITSKIWPSEYGEGITMNAIDKMLERLGTDYIDLLYVHQPMGDYYGAWRDMEKAVVQGKVKSLGISNFDVSDSIFQTIIDFAVIKPAVMQIEVHPYAQRIEWQNKLKKYGIQLECWYPLGGAASNGVLFLNPIIRSIASNYGKTAAQIILRWHIQEGFSVIPGSINYDHIIENISIFDFELTDEEMTAIRTLNKEERFFNMNYKEAEQFMLNWKIED